MILAYTAIPGRDKSLSLMCSDREFLTTKSWSGVISFLLKPCTMGLVWNVDAFAEAVFSVFPKEFRSKIKEDERVFAPDSTKFFYSPGRVLGITYAGQEVNFYSLSRYTDEEILDAKALEVFGSEVLKAYGELGITPTRLASPVSCYPLDKVPYPRACDLPESALEMTNVCSKAMSREWRDVYRLGHWKKDEVFDYDLRGAYPSLLSGLPDISKATFFTSNSLPSHYSWGELFGKLKINKDVSPFVHEETENFPKGEWDDSITTDQLWLLKKYEIGEFEIEKGYFLLLPASYLLPFQHTMARLYAERESLNPLTARIAKAVSVGIGGKLHQRFEDNGKSKLGTDFNSIYARMVTSRCMVKTCDFIYRNHMENDLVSVMVDGCLTTERVELPSCKTMGTWRLNDPSPFLVASLLFQWGAEKRPNGKTYDEMMAMIQKSPGQSEYSGVDLNLLEYSRNFPQRPRTGGSLMGNKYISQPFTVGE